MSPHRSALAVATIGLTISACSDLVLEHIGAGGSMPSGSSSIAHASTTTAQATSNNASSSASSSGGSGAGGMTSASVGTGGMSSNNTVAASSSGTGGTGGQIPILFGDTIVEQSIDDHPAGTAEASAFYALEDGTVNSLSVYYAYGDATKLLIGLYDDSGGHPHTLLATATVNAPVMASWNAGVVPPTAVTKGTVYWIALVAPVGFAGNFAMPYLYLSQVLTTEHSEDTMIVSLPNPWVSGQVFNPSRNSFYASP